VTELWTTAEAAECLGASSVGSVRKTLSRLGVVPVSREPGRRGQNLYDPAEVRAAKARMPGRGKRSLKAGPGTIATSSRCNLLSCS
jgi:KaiC/GvpD/RAD55 family RecA-like ATPase